MNLRWLAILASLATPVHAETPIHVFTVGSDQLQVPVPDGYCLPEGDDLAQSRQNAARDLDNVTLGDFIACGRNPPIAAGLDYVLLKAPNDTVNETYPKAPVLDELAAYFQSQGGTILDEKTETDMEQQLGREFGVQPDLEFSAHYAGRDEDCVYVAGQATVTISDRASKSGIFIGCSTVAQGKLLSIAVYRFVAGSTIEEIKALARTIARSMDRVPQGSL